MTSTDRNDAGPSRPPDGSSPWAPPSRFDRFQHEVMAGGSVDESVDDQPTEPIGGGVEGALGGLAIIGLLVWLGLSNGWMLVFVVGILVSVFLHELGHFLTARLTGMKATQFFIGFGPRLWSFHRGETEYGVRLLPLGAFVKIIGMNNLDTVPAADEGRTYRQKSFPRRLLVVTAGSVMHLLIAVVLFFGLFAVKGEPVAVPGAEVRLVSQGSAADAAGLREGDVILAVGDAVIGTDGDIGAAVRASAPGDNVAVRFDRGGAEQTASATLGTNDDPASEFVGSALLGVSSSGASEWRDLSLGEAAVTSVTELFPTTWESTKGIVKVLNPVNIVQHLTGSNDDIATRPTTLVGVTQDSGDIGRGQGIAGIMYLLAVLNVFVGVFNMFPLLPLDGGHAAIAIYERIRERMTGARRYFVDVSRLTPFAMGVIAVLPLLFMSGLYLDITQPL
ncbi:hypothetical protein BH24ACT5_BH24ACT5_15560 [soil metagenome]